MLKHKTRKDRSIKLYKSDGIAPSESGTVSDKKSHADNGDNIVQNYKGM